MDQNANQANQVKIDISGVDANEQEIINALTEAIDQIKNSQGKLNTKAAESSNEFEKITLGQKVVMSHRS